MNPRNRRFALVLWLVLAVAAAGTAFGKDGGGKSDAPEQASAAKPDPALLDLVKVTQELARKSQAELEIAHRQNESLQRLLEQTNEELARLRGEMNQLRSSVLSLQSGAAPAAGVNQATDRGQAAKIAVADSRAADSQEGMSDQVEINRTQIKELDQTKVESDSRFKVRLFGTILSNTYYNTGDASDEAVPTSAPSKSEARENFGHNFGATYRQTDIGFALTGPRIGSAKLSAAVDFDFFGGSEEYYDGVSLGTLRMRTAAVRIDGSRSSLALGLMSPVFSPLNPTSLASAAYPALGDSGNLWQWLPQITAEHRAPLSESNEFILRGGVMMPFGETFGDSELAGKPGYESRIAFARKIGDDRHLEIGFGGYVRPFRFSFGRTVDTFATSGDWLIPLTRRLEFSGEAYFGRGVTLSTPSGGDISSAFAITGPLEESSTAIRGIYSFGGWSQLKVKATSRLEFNAALGMAEPRNRDVFSGLTDETTMLKNQTVSINSILRLRSNFLLSLEYRRLWTTYLDARTNNDHINLAIGYLF